MIYGLQPASCLEMSQGGDASVAKFRKAAFHYSSQLQTWSKKWLQAGRKHVERQLRACLKRVFLHFICLACGRTSEPAAVRDQVFDKKVESWSKANRKPARTCRKPGCKPGRKLGLQLARIMECGSYKCRPSWTFVPLRPHSIILASYKPGCKPNFRPGFRQVCAGLRYAFDTLSTFSVDNLVATRSRFAGLCAC